MEPRPKFRPDLESSPIHESGGENNIVLKDPVSEKYFRLSEWEYELLRILDGKISVDEAVIRLKSLGHYYSEEDARLIISKAAQAGLLLGTGYGTVKFQKELGQRLVDAKKSRRLAGMYFMFIPLINPDKFLERTIRLYRGVANKWTVSMLALLTPGAVYIGLLAAMSKDSEFLFFFNLHNLLYLWVTLGITKLVHEFAHAYRAKSFGLRVPQMGVAFLIFFPCLYCNTTQAWQLADRKERVSISVAGIVAEGALAILASYVWYFSRPGVLNSLAFYLMAVSFVSTVLFNANPLMRYDGYYILSDLLGVTNLSSKSLSYMRFLFMNGVMGLQGIQNPSGTPRETLIFVSYGVSALLYRAFLYFAIVLGVYYRFNKLIGVILALLGLFALVLLPVARGMKNLYLKRSEICPNPKGAAIFSLMILVVLFLLLKPMSSKTVYPCYLDAVLSQKITIPLHTSISKVLIREGQPAQKDSLLLQLDPTLLELDLYKKRIDCLTTRIQVELLLLDDKEMSKAAEKLVESEQLEHETRLLETDLGLARDGIVAPFSGVVTRLDYRVQNGFQPGKGAIVGDLKSKTDCVIRILVPESDRNKVFKGQNVHMWFPVRYSGIYADKVEQIMPYSEKDLRNSPFSSRFGGEIATEPKSETQRDAPLDAQYVCQVPFNNTEGLPLGLTGRCAVESPPKSMLSRFISTAARAFNRESLL
ncbi:MAG: site-2 protease family protein [Pseudomonadota bacterium]